MAELPAGAEYPLELVTEEFDSRLTFNYIAGVILGAEAVGSRLVEAGIIEPKSPEEVAFRHLTDPGSIDVYNGVLQDPTAQAIQRQWQLDLDTFGFTRVFGDDAAINQRELQTTQRPDSSSTPDSPPYTASIYIGELPVVLEDDRTIDALQNRLDAQYGRSDVSYLIGPPMEVLALYEDISVSLRPIARTLVQHETEIWHIATRAHLAPPDGL